MKINYYRDGYGLCTEINADYKTNTVHIVNHTDNPLDMAFGVKKNPTIEDFEEFLADRCFPKTRHRLDLNLKVLGLHCGYEPYTIAKALDGRVDGDDHYLEFVKEGEFAKDQK